MLLAAVVPLGGESFLENGTYSRKAEMRNRKGTHVLVTSSEFWIKPSLQTHASLHSAGTESVVSLTVQYTRNSESPGSYTIPARLIPFSSFQPEKLHICSVVELVQMFLTSS